MMADKHSKVLVICLVSLLLFAPSCSQMLESAISKNRNSPSYMSLDFAPSLKMEVEGPIDQSKRYRLHQSIFQPYYI
ncbi:hypothetical protein BS78_02G100800 [Paspalum vaginatum]|nr:hypothetical protein BS78_02G100800 [Paspalum vaginatum]